MKNLIKLFSAAIVAGFVFASCEGPAGPQGPKGADGTNGTNGVDANQTCKECHAPSVVDSVVKQFEFSKHEYGEAAFEEAGSTGCAPCHESEAFKYVSSHNTPTTFTLNATTGKYSNDYAVPANVAYGELDCFTCHSSLHTSYEYTDFSPLTSIAAVNMTMWKGTKTINLTQDGASSNLCVKCHQPRPLTTSSTLSDGNVIDYASFVSNPADTFYRGYKGNAAPNKLLPSYRMHVHYGTVGAIYAGKGGVEFTGSKTYTNSTHTTVASCNNCHMAPVTGRAGGHTFRMRSGEGALTTQTAWNFNGCNVCHTSGIDANNTTFWKTPRTAIQTLLNNLATKINNVGGGTAILHANSDGTSNLWAGITTGNWDGYTDIYDPSTNPTGAWKNPGSTSSWTTAQKATNNALPTFPSLKNAVIGSMINFQLCLREFSLGIHNYKYTEALLTNSIEAMTTAGY